MLEYPEVITIVKQMQAELIGRTVQSGMVVKKNSNMFMSESDAERYGALCGGKVTQIDCQAPDFYIMLDNGYGILVCQSGGKLLFNATEADRPKTYNIVFEFTDGSSLTYTMSLFTLGFFAATHDEWLSRKQADTKFDPLGEASFEGYQAYLGSHADQGKSAIKLFLAKNMLGVMSSFAAEALLYAKVHPSTQVGRLSDAEHRSVYEAMRMVLTAAADAGGRTSEHDLYGNKGRYLAQAERKRIGQDCPLCGGVLAKASVGGVTAFCPSCQPKAKQPKG